MNNITLADLEQWKTEGQPFVLIDVREPFEHEHFNIGGQNIPLASLSAEIGKFSQEERIVLYCAKGIRSVIGLQRLETKGYKHVFNLTGGIQLLSD